MNANSRKAAVAFAIALASAVSAQAEPAQWTTVERCEPAGTAAPGKGFFEIRYKTRGIDAEAIEIRGCGANSGYRKVIEWGGDAGVLEAYALPFFDKRRRDILIMHGLDVDATYYLLTAASNYEKTAVMFEAIDAPFFGDADEDGRWEIRIRNLRPLSCGNDAKWGQNLLGPDGADLRADTLCKP